MSEFIHRSRSELEVAAIGYQCELIVPAANQICLDWDQIKFGSGGDQSPSEWCIVYKHLNDDYGVVGEERWASRNGNTHMLVTLGRDVEPLERIALQAICGSDPHRELNALRDWAESREDPSVLFKPLPRQITCPTPDVLVLVEDDIPF